MQIQRQKQLFKSSFMFPLVLLSTLTHNDAIAKDPPSYVLMCQGGGVMSIALDVAAKGSNNQLRIFQFGQAKQAAGTKPPDAGQCAWLDRPFLASEPKNIIWAAPQISKMSLTVVNSQHAGTGPKNYVSYDISNPQVKYLYDAVIKGQDFQVHVFAKSGSFHITKIGP